MRNSPSIWLHNTNLFDGTGSAQQPRDIEIAEGLIRRVVAPNTDLWNEPGKHFDLGGKSVLPGLIDAHAHVGILNLQNQISLAPPVQAAMVFKILRSSIDQGFTTLRDLGGVDSGLVQAVDMGLVEGPRILPSGQILSQTGGHGDSRPKYCFCAHNPSTGMDTFTLPMVLADGVDEVIKATRAQLKRGATQIKVFATGGQLSEGDPVEAPQFNEAEIRAIVEVAADRDTYVTAHGHTVRGIQRAVKAGVRCIEHGSILDEATVELLRSTGTFVVPTLTISESLRVNHAAMGVPPEWIIKNDEISIEVERSIRMLDAAGVEMGSGSDIIGPDQDIRGWELALKAEILGSAKAIVSATLTNAKIMGLDQDLGSVEPGKIADLVVFDENPVENPNVFRQHFPSVVILGGQITRGAEALSVTAP